MHGFLKSRLCTQLCEWTLWGSLVQVRFRLHHVSSVRIHMRTPMREVQNALLWNTVRNAVFGTWSFHYISYVGRLVRGRISQLLYNQVCEGSLWGRPHSTNAMIHCFHSVRIHLWRQIWEGHRAQSEKLRYEEWSFQLRLFHYVGTLEHWHAMWVT